MQACDRARPFGCPSGRFEWLHAILEGVRVALLSDIHSNLPALRAVLGHLDRPDGEGGRLCSCAGHPRVDAIWCLGDTVGYNAHPAECLDIVRRQCDVVLLGNHDWAVVHGDTRTFNPNASAGVAHARRSLGSKDIDYLESLQPSRRTKRELLCHASPDDPLWEYVDAAGGEKLLGRGDLPPIVAFGHTHVPFVAQTPQRTVLNAGSVGQPRDGDPRAAFLTLDTETRAWQLHRVSYDIEEAARSVREAGLPRLLGERLFLGR